jgi:hypothetical protein
MKTRYQMTIALAGVLALAPATIAAERGPDSKQVTQMAKNATTPADHEKVARHYLDLSKAQNEKAEKLEQEMKEMKAGPKSPMEVKWPAMVVNARERKERLAMQARRAAQESHRLAEHHSKQAGRSLDQIADVD